jgi:hypothetical protein
LEIPGFSLEVRISKLETVIVELKATRFGSRLGKKIKKEGQSGP